MVGALSRSTRLPGRVSRAPEPPAAGHGHRQHAAAVHVHVVVDLHDSHNRLKLHADALVLNLQRAHERIAQLLARLLVLGLVGSSAAFESTPETSPASIRGLALSLDAQTEPRRRRARAVLEAFGVISSPLWHTVGLVFGLRPRQLAGSDGPGALSATSPFARHDAILCLATVPLDPRLQ